jgi:ribosome assembly protein RRB1
VASSTHDINVISWNRKVPYLLLSGADDGEFCVWDLRALRTPDAAAAAAANKPVKTEPLARSTWHRKPISSIEWSPHDPNCLVACSEDDTVTVWDMSLEPDADADADAAAAAAAASASSAAPAEADFPAQLLFIHQGQSQIKEAHFIEQIPGVIMTTAGTGFNVFKPDVQLA